MQKLIALALAALSSGVLAFDRAALQDATPAPADAARASESAPAEPLTVVLVRHAEKEAGPEDPGLSPEGATRARDLARLLEAAGVTHLFCTEFRRTKATLEPLAERTRLDIAAVPARDVGGLARRLVELPAGSVAVVAGHSNTVPAIARALGVEAKGLVPGRAGDVLDESVYDRLYVVTLDAASARAPKLLELRFPER